MTLNPRDYDLDELRKMARERPGNGLEDDLDPEDIDLDVGEDDPVAAGDSFRAGLYHELLPFIGDGIEKPYLRSMPDSYGAEVVVFEWLEFLLMHSGYQGAEDALDYYEDVDWITESARDDLSEYLRGLDDAGSGDGQLDVDDHMLSLVYVAKLQAMA